MMIVLGLSLLATIVGGVDGDPPPLRVCMVSGSVEYESDASLADFQKELEARYPVRCTLLRARGESELPGLEALKTADAALFFTRRLTIDGDDLAKVREYAEAGRPIVGVRTASHGFQRWLEFDRIVLGGNYRNHYGNGKTTRVQIVPESAGHPVLKDVSSPFETTGSLYRNAPLADPDATILMRGTSPEATEPVAWVREFRGARIFYTSLGAQADFANPAFRRLLTNALFWTARRAPPVPITRGREAFAQP